MQHFVSQSNIDRFKRLIATSTDPSQIKTLENLLQIEEQRLAAWDAEHGRKGK